MWSLCTLSVEILPNMLIQHLCSFGGSHFNKWYTGFSCVLWMSICIIIIYLNGLYIVLNNKYPLCKSAKDLHMLYGSPYALGSSKDELPHEEAGSQPLDRILRTRTPFTSSTSTANRWELTSSIYDNCILVKYIFVTLQWNSVSFSSSNHGIAQFFFLYN